MDRTYRKFLRSGIDLAPVGIERREENTPYFCTPRGASVFGWAGVDGIHFCFIRGFGGMVFAVSPMNSAPDYVHPLARDFADFLRLILACGEEAALEQAWMWEEAQFEAFLRENPPMEKQRQTMAEISEKMNLTPMEQPWAYIKALQSGFDNSRIRYTEDYYDPDMNPAAEQTPPEWKVFFDGSFWNHPGKGRAGKEIRVDRQFDWAGHRWVIPAVYSCGKGLVVDFCMQVEPEKIRSFRQKWKLDQGNDSCAGLTREQQMQREAEDPFGLHFVPRLEGNGKLLRASHGCSVCFNPCLPEGMITEWEAKWAALHYGLDTSCGWVICRSAFPWEGKRPAGIRSLVLTLEQQPKRVPGPHFTAHAPGDSFPFSHPVSGQTHILTVQELEQQTIPQNTFGSAGWIYPTHVVVMRYTLSPEPAESITVLDCAEGDRPREITAPQKDAFCPVAVNSCCVILGGADGSTAAVLKKDGSERSHAACSALHFDPIQGDVEWGMVFSEKEFGEASFVLI